MPPTRKKIGLIFIALIFMQISMFHLGTLTLVNQQQSDTSHTFANAAQSVDSAGEIRASGGETLFINELMADNDKTISDGNGIYSDWIELYNAGNTALNISGMYLTNDLSDPVAWQIPNGTMLDIGAYILIWADGNAIQLALNSPFELSASGDFVALIAADGKTVIDSVTFGKQIRDTSYGRFPNGVSEWYYLTQPTPASANSYQGTTGGIPGWVMLILVVIAGVLLFGMIFSKHIRMRRGDT